MWVHIYITDLNNWIGPIARGNEKLHGATGLQMSSCPKGKSKIAKFLNVLIHFSARCMARVTYFYGRISLIQWQGRPSGNYIFMMLLKSDICSSKYLVELYPSNTIVARFLYIQLFFSKSPSRSTLVWEHFKISRRFIELISDSPIRQAVICVHLDFTEIFFRKGTTIWCTACIQVFWKYLW